MILFTSRLAKSKLGFSLIEVMIVVAIMGVVAAGVIALMENILTAQSTQRYGSNTLNLVDEIRSTLGSPLACVRSFGGFTVATAAGTNHPLAGAQKIYDNAVPANLMYDADITDPKSRDKDNAVQIKSMTFTDYKDMATPGTATFGLITLEVNYHSVAKQGVNNPWMKQTMQIQTQTIGGVITACVAMAKMNDTIWSLVPNTAYDIYFNGGVPNGHVGIGTAAPITALDLYRAEDAQTISRVLNDSNKPNAMAVVQTSNGKTDAKFYTAGQGAASQSGILTTSTTAFVTEADNNTTSMIWRTGTAPTNKMILLSNGNVGIATDTPTQTLTVQGTGLIKQTPTTAVQLGPTAANPFELSSFGGKVYFENGANTSLTFASQTGNQGGLTLVTPAPTAIGEINGFIHRAGIGGNVATFMEDFYWNGTRAVPQIGSVTAGTPFELYAGNSTIITLNPHIGPAPGNAAINGLFTINTATQAGYDFVDGGNAWFQKNVDVAGTVTAQSDRRLKQNIAPIDHALENILRLEGRQYFWKDRQVDPSLQYGLIAQDVAEVFPNLVPTNSQGILGVRYLELIAPIIESVKAIFHRLVATEQTTAALEQELTATKIQLEQTKQEFNLYRAQTEARLRALEAKTH